MCKTQGRVQEPTKLGKGREEVEAFMQEVFDAVPDDSYIKTSDLPSAFSGLLNVSWLYGYN